MQKSLKNPVLIAFLAVIFSLNNALIAQKIDFGISTGTGKSYIVEHSTRSVNVNYGLPIALMGELKYTPTQKSWGIKLRVTSLQSRIKGDNWDSYANITPSGFAGNILGNIHTLSTNILLEKEYTKGKWHAGFNIGFGLTKETLTNQMYGNTYTRTENYTNMMLGGVFGYEIAPDFALQCQPICMMQDVYGSMGWLTGTSKPNLGREDLSFFTNIGVVYRLKK